MDHVYRHAGAGRRGANAAAARLRTLLGGALLLGFTTACGADNTPAPTATTGATAAITVSVAAPTMTAAPASGVPTATSAPPATAPPTAGGKGTFQNPVLEDDFPDPFILTVGTTYYAYATNGSGKNIQRARSTDLVHWEILSDALPALPSWAQMGGSLVWAPEVLAVGDHYVMYYTARDTQSDKQCIGVAVGSTPDGRFKDTNDKPFVCEPDQGGDIDPDVFRDGDKVYFYWKNDGNCCGLTTHLYGQELSADGLHRVGPWPAALEENDQLWEGRVVEAPTMVQHGGHYYLFYSGNDYAGLPYAVGYAACDGPLGPCRDAPENPILKSRPEPPPVVGPGHQSIVQVGDQTWIVYHVWEMVGGLRGDRRFLWIDRITWEGDKPHVQGPTIGPQALPGSAP
jgi:beta-xylosidase